MNICAAQSSNQTMTISHQVGKWHPDFHDLFYDKKDAEAFPLLDVKVEALRYRDIWTATATMQDAFLNDPVMKYLDDGPDRHPRASRAAQVAILAAWIQTRISLTIERGSALVIAESTAPKKLVHRILDSIISAFLTALSSVDDAEHKKRVKEWQGKYKKAIEECIGDRLKDLWAVHLLCTSPQYQGHGYGSALLGTITSAADQESKDAWLLSSNIANEAFYNSHGFVTVKDIILGEDNPAWKQDPVVAQLMIRQTSASQITS